MRHDANICDAIGCMREASYIREEERLRYPEQLCAACYNKRVKDIPRDASRYRLLANLAPPLPSLAVHAGKVESRVA